MSIRNVLRSRFRKSESFVADSATIKEAANQPVLNDVPPRSHSMDFTEDVIEEQLAMVANETLVNADDGAGDASDVSNRPDTTRLVLSKTSGRRSVAAGGDLELACSTATPTSVLEAQIKELQMQLLSVTISNQNLVDELKSVKVKNRVDKLEKELKEERERYEKLLTKFKELAASDKGLLRGFKLTRPGSLFSRKPDSEDGGVSTQQLTPTSVTIDQETSTGGSSCESLADKIGPRSSPTGDFLSDPGQQQQLQQSTSFWARWKQRLIYFSTEFLDDLRAIDESPDVLQDDRDGEPLSPKRLKDNISRLSRAFEPIGSTFNGFKALVQWRHPTYTLLVFLMFVYMIWVGWLIPLTFILALLRVIINYFKYRCGWAINLHFLCDYEQQCAAEKENKVAAQIGFVVHVARKCQNISGQVANVLEKLNNLLTWRCPEYTMEIIRMLSLLLLLSICISTDTFLFAICLYLMVKIFVIDYIFLRFPRLQRKYDQFYRVWTALPTDSQFVIYSASREVEKYILPTNEGELDPTLMTTSGTENGSMSTDDRLFCDMLSLPYSECPLPCESST